jgi:hypothetical protein
VKRRLDLVMQGLLTAAGLAAPAGAGARGERSI